MFVNKAILNNINVTKITSYLRSKNIKQDEEQKEINLYLGELLASKQINSNEINDYLFDELMFGNRRFVRCYELQTIRKIKRETDWSDFLEKYNCDNMNFNKILQTNLTTDEKLKVAAIRSKKNTDSSLQYIEILFVYYMALSNSNDGIEYCYSYLPVSIDLVKKTLTIKVWNREKAIEENSPSDQLDKIYNILTSNLDFKTRPISSDPQKVLYRMSKDLFDEFFKQLPNYLDIENKKDNIDYIVSQLLKDINLSNVNVLENKIEMNPEIINVNDEIYKLLQQIALYDYLKDNSLESLLSNTDKLITRIRFNDRDNLSASLTSEAGVKCIFDTKTFMCVRNSLDLVENIVSIVVTIKRSRGQMMVKYDASDSRFLNIHILKSLYYTNNDFNTIWELYNKYESESNVSTNTLCDENNAQAM